MIKIIEMLVRNAQQRQIFLTPFSMQFTLSAHEKSSLRNFLDAAQVRLITCGSYSLSHHNFVFF